MGTILVWGDFQHNKLKNYAHSRCIPGMSLLFSEVLSFLHARKIVTLKTFLCLPDCHWVVIAWSNDYKWKKVDKDLMFLFSELLDSSSDGIEVSYNACGVLAHLMSDGPGVWHIQTPSRDSVLRNMVQAICRWKLNTKRNINYRWVNWSKTCTVSCG